MNVWIYNESPIKEKIVFSFRMRLKKKYANSPFYSILKVGDAFGLNFKET